MSRRKYNDEDVIKAVEESNSMREAAKKAGIPMNVFKGYCKRLNIWKPNQSYHPLTGNYKKWTKEKYIDFLNSGKCKHQSYKLKLRLIELGIKENKCDICGLEGTWNGKELQNQLHHKDGNKFNNKLENLQILCPNCHSQTDTYVSKNLSKNKVRKLY